MFYLLSIFRLSDGCWNLGYITAAQKKFNLNGSNMQAGWQRSAMRKIVIKIVNKWCVPRKDRRGKKTVEENKQREEKN